MHAVLFTFGNIPFLDIYVMCTTHAQKQGERWLIWLHDHGSCVLCTASLAKRTFLGLIRGWGIATLLLCLSLWSSQWTLLMKLPGQPQIDIYSQLIQSRLPVLTLHVKTKYRHFERSKNIHLNPKVARTDDVFPQTFRPTGQHHRMLRLFKQTQGVVMDGWMNKVMSLST